jgi:hypothetical protein
LTKLEGVVGLLFYCINFTPSAYKPNVPHLPNTFFIKKVHQPKPFFVTKEQDCNEDSIPIVFMFLGAYFKTQTCLAQSSIAVVNT